MLHNRKISIGSIWKDIKLQKVYAIISWEHSLGLPSDSLLELEDTLNNSISVLKSQLLNSKHEGNFRYQRLD